MIAAAADTTLRDRLRRQYAGVLRESAIDRHIEEHVGLPLARQSLDLVLRAGRPASLLDVGAGYGSFVLAAREAGIDAAGIELERFEVDFARRRLATERPGDAPETIYREGSALSLPYDANTFDAVTMWNVLEHVPDANKALAEAHRVLKPGGRLFLICPNYAAFRTEAHYHVWWLPLFPRSLASRYLRLLGRDPGFFERHIYYTTNRSVLAALGRLGFELRDPRDQRLASPETIHNARVRAAVAVLGRIGLVAAARGALALALRSPIKSSVSVVARKR